MSYQAIIFDLDGTLLDTIADIANAANQVLTSRHFPVHPLWAYRQFVGKGIRQLIIQMLPASNRDPDTIQDCFQAFRQVYGQNWNVTTRPYEGICETLAVLAAQGVKFAVLSNKLHTFTQQCVNQYLSQFTFAAVVGAGGNLPEKPDPTGALQIVRRLGIPPPQIVYLGDSGIDMETAKAARIMAVGALWGFRSRNELLKAGADLLIHQPRELLQLF